MLDVVLAGAGLAGATAALALARAGRAVAVLDPAPASGASAAAAGLVHPVPGRRAAPAWRHAEAADALADALDAAGHALGRPGVLRPAADARQAEAFAQSAAAHADLAAWLAPAAAAERFAHVASPHGALWVPSGAHVEIPAFVDALLAAARARGADVRAGTRLVGWTPEAGGVRVRTVPEADLVARHLVVAVGDGFRGVGALAGLPLSRTKGQTATLGAALPAGSPAVAGGAYLVPGDKKTVVGATYEHVWDAPGPTDAASALLRERAARLVPALAGAAVVGARAGVRVGVPAALSPRRLPWLGPVADGVWLLAGLGSKGLLYAPLLARWLPDALGDPRTLPAEVRPPAPPAAAYFPRSPS